MKQFSMSQLHEKLGTLGPNELILDVRSPAEFASGHVPGSRNIPHDQVAPHVEELRKFDAIYLHCRSGARASHAAQVLTSAGLNNIVCISGGGMADWMAAGLPVETE